MPSPEIAAFLRDHFKSVWALELLLFLNQYRRNANIDGEKVDQNRVVLTMVPVKGEWKVAAATAI